MEKIKLIVLSGVVLAFFSGCSTGESTKTESVKTTVSSSKNSSINQEDKVKTKQDFSEGSDLTKAKESGETMLGVIVTPEDSQYETYVEIIDKICKEKNIGYVVVDSSDKNNEAWIKNNGILGVRAISVVHANEMMSMALDYDDEFNYAFLANLVDDFIADLEEMALKK